MREPCANVTDPDDTADPHLFRGDADGYKRATPRWGVEARWLICRGVRCSSGWSWRGARFAALDAADQDALLSDLEANASVGFAPGAAAFFNLVLTHTIQGTFSDPAHGGNVDFIGWRMLGYPGVRTIVTPDLQRMDRMPPSRQVSAYDFPAFSAARERRTRGR